jgi:hypothetical protein
LQAPYLDLQAPAPNTGLAYINEIAWSQTG